MRFSFFKPHLVAPLLVVLGATPATIQAQTSGDNTAEKTAEPVEIDLSPQFERWNLGFKFQRQRNTCAVFTVTGAIEFGLSKTLNEGVIFSEEYLNWAANEANGDREDGATFPQLQRGFAKWGVAEEREMPYRRTFGASNVPSQSARTNARQVEQLKPKWNWIARDRTSGLTAADIAAIQRVLRRGFPVCAEGEHCLLLVGYNKWEGKVSFLARDYARQNYEILSPADVQRRFQSLLWIQFPDHNED